MGHGWCPEKYCCNGSKREGGSVGRLRWIDMRLSPTQTTWACPSPNPSPSPSPDQMVSHRGTLILPCVQRTQMASSKLLSLRRLSRALKPPPPSSLVTFTSRRSHQFLPCLNLLQDTISRFPLSSASRSFCSPISNLDDVSQSPAAIDYRCVEFWLLLYK